MLYLLPNVLDDEENWFSPAMVRAVTSMQGLIAESEKGGRRFLLRFFSREQMNSMPLRLLNEHTPSSELENLLDPVAKGERWGLISDAGLPCIADPGASLVLRARQRQLAVSTFPGPSSPIIALQLSGLNGQRFSFHGYLPHENLEKTLVRLEERSIRDKASQIWIETPYRNGKMVAAALDVLHSMTLLCLAVEVMSERASVETRTIAEWRKNPPIIKKAPCIFLLEKP